MAANKLALDSIFAPAPTTTRGQPTQLSSDPKGQYLAYGSGKSVFVRSIDDPSEASQYIGHTATATVARFSPNGFKVASGDVSGIVQVWEPMNIENTKATFTISAGRVNDIAWDGDSQRIIAVGDGRDRFGKAITADSGNSIGEISGHAKPINAVAIRQSRPLRAVTVADDGAVCFLHGVPFTFKTKEAGKHGGNFVYTAAYSPDGAVFLTAGADRRIHLWDGRDGTHLREIGGGGAEGGGHTGSVLAAAWAPGGAGTRFATASADQTVRLWDVETGRAVETWRFGQSDGQVSVRDQQLGVVYPAGRSDDMIISLSLCGNLNYLAVGTPTQIRVVEGHSKAITAIGVSPAWLPTLWTGSFDGRVCQWDVSTGHAITVAGESHTNQVVAFAAADIKDMSGKPAGRKKSTTAYSVGWDDSLRTMDEASVAFVGQAAQLPAQPSGVAQAGNGRVYVTTAEGVAMYERDGKQLLETKPVGFVPACIAAHGNTIAVGGDANNAIRIYDGETLAPAAATGSISPPTTTGTVSTLAFSADGRYLAAGNTVGKICVYDTARDWAVAVDRWTAHTARVTSIAWEAGGRHAASGSVDTNVHIWCMDPSKQGRRIRAPNAHKDGVTGVCWISGDMVASAGGDAAVKVWKLDGGLP